VGSRVPKGLVGRLIKADVVMAIGGGRPIPFIGFLGAAAASLCAVQTLPSASAYPTPTIVRVQYSSALLDEVFNPQSNQGDSQARACTESPLGCLG